MRITRDWLKEHGTSKNAWTNAQLRILGVPWPPRKGWLTQLIGVEISDASARQFEELGRRDRIAAPPVQPVVLLSHREQRDRKREKKRRRLERAQARPKPPRITRREAFALSEGFLLSAEWRRLRMLVITKRGARCECCGASPKDGVTVINVDHIKPRKWFPQLALVESNLQILCGVCNHGKGNWDQTDWRKDAPVEPVRVEPEPLTYEEVRPLWWAPRLVQTT